jgi:hypothetical protein
LDKGLRLDGTRVAAAAQVYATLPDSAFLRSADFPHLVAALHPSFAGIYACETLRSAGEGPWG